METHLLSDVEQELYLQPVSLGKRFANLLLDFVGIFVFVSVVGFLLGIASAINGDGAYRNDDNPFFENVIGYLCYLIYYTIFEGVTKGRSLGKFITGTVAVKSDGTPLTWKEAFLRSLSRLVPFEALSAFGQAPWHDTWTNTVVIRKVS